MAKALRIGGFVSGAILIAFGVVVIALAINARSIVTDDLSAEKIVGSADMNPSDIEAAMKEAGLCFSRPLFGPVQPNGSLQRGRAVDRQEGLFAQCFGCVPPGVEACNDLLGDRFLQR